MLSLSLGLEKGHFAVETVPSFWVVGSVQSKGLTTVGGSG